jgi:hypothetical protein
MIYQKGKRVIRRFDSITSKPVLLGPYKPVYAPETSPVITANPPAPYSNPKNHLTNYTGFPPTEP